MRERETERESEHASGKRNRGERISSDFMLSVVPDVELDLMTLRS